MPPPQTNFVASTDKAGYDPATLSDEEDYDDARSDSTWASTSDATILGFADGFLGKESRELADWKVSRIGGLPSFPLSTVPPQSASTCLSCSRAMPLLTQIYCPLESSALERVVYVFGCPRAACKRKDGSIRAWRANCVWKEQAEEEKRREEREKERDRAKPAAVDLGGLIFGGGAPSMGATPTPAAANANPFAPTPSSSLPSNPFAAPSPVVMNPFAPVTASPLNPFAPTPSAPPAPAPPAPVPAPATPVTNVVSTSWSTGPSYPAQYVTTSYEPPSTLSSKALPPLANLKLTDPASDDPDLSSDEEPSHRAGKGAGGRTKKGSGGGQGRANGSGGQRGGAAGKGGADGWGKEGYEVQKLKGVDEVFLRFQERVSREGLQIIRYEHASTPLPFCATSSAYLSLFPPPSSSSAPTSAGASDVGVYTPARIPACRTCRAPSTFEYQLMPHLVSVLNKTEGLRGRDAFGDEKREGEGLDWATVWVFSCTKECGEERDGGRREAWREERVMVEWEE
ncbi:hypothetical protein JCM21900_000367 [Sporobolomyces salmonicolor]